nr:RNA-directed DNA polymerase, eukaryota [Tanacetum cinerariifolium]
MGQIPEAFPPKVLAGYIQYKILFSQEGVPPFDYTLQFCATFKLPWIISFTYKKKEAEGVSPQLLIGQFSSKWWKQLEEKQAEKEAVNKYYNSFNHESPSTSRFWNIVGPDLCLVVEWFFHHAFFPVGCNSSFIALIPKTLNPKSVGIKIESSTTLSYLFYADDAVFIGEWSRGNLTGIMHTLRCFSLLSGLSINIKKSQLLGVGIPDSHVLEAATLIGCSVLHTPFKYLGIMVGENMSSIRAWDETVNKLKLRLSSWKLKTISIGDRLTLLKSVLGSTPIYNMSFFKVPKAVLKSMESIQRNFFNGIRDGEKKIAWVSWCKVLASKSNGGLGVSSFYALNRGLLFKWIWRFLSRDQSLWSQVIHALHGSNTSPLSAFYSSL